MKLGIIGGFGGFATLDFFGRLLGEFASETERSYPHIVMDNNFSMPSRTKALLTGEGQKEIVHALADSMHMMLREDVDFIILVCGTAHAFLPDVYALVPEAEQKVLHIVHLMGEEMQQKRIKKVLVLAAEGVLRSELYSRLLFGYGISCVEPEESAWPEIRNFIEMVKTNSYPQDAANRFTDFVGKYDTEDVVLGCTELPVLLKEISSCCPGLSAYRFHDPLDTVLKILKRMSTEGRDEISVKEVR